MSGWQRRWTLLGTLFAVAFPLHAARIEISERTMLELCREVQRWRLTLVDRALSESGRASARSVARLIRLHDGASLGIPHAAVESIHVDAPGDRLDSFILEFEGDAQRSFTVSWRMGELLAQRWSEGGPTYLELLGEALAPDAPKLACRRGGDRAATVRASLAQATAIIFLRADSGAELYHHQRDDQLLVRKHFQVEDGSEWIDWNAVVPTTAGTGSTIVIAHWRFGGGELGAMAPMAEDGADTDSVDTGAADPPWVAALGAVIVGRDADGLFELARVHGWACTASAGSVGRPWCGGPDASTVTPTAAH